MPEKQKNPAAGDGWRAQYHAGSPTPRPEAAPRFPPQPPPAAPRQTPLSGAGCRPKRLIKCGGCSLGGNTRSRALRVPGNLPALLAASAGGRLASSARLAAFGCYKFSASRHIEKPIQCFLLKSCVYARICKPKR